MIAPRTLKEAQERYVETAEDLEEFDDEELARELRGLERLICWMRILEVRAA